MPLFHRISCKQYIGALNGEKASTITMVIHSDINSLAPVAGGRFLPPKDFGFKVAAMPTPSQTLTERPGMNSCHIDPKQIDSGFKVLQVVSQDRRLIYLFMHVFFPSGAHICFTIEFNKMFFVLEVHCERAQKQIKNKPKTE